MKRAWQRSSTPRPGSGSTTVIWIAQARLAASGDEAGLKALQDELFSRQGDDNLTLIQGIGKASADALQGAGIASYAALAAATPDQLSEIMSEAGVRRGNFDAWIEEAKMRAAGRRIARGGRTRSAPAGATAMPCPQDLGQVLGIGEVYEQRLYSVGVGTFWELSMIPQDELSEILEIQDFQDVDLESIQKQAKELAESTESMGRIWDGTEPDDFEVLEGIGEVYERRLYAAGICTFSALAELSVEKLTEICQAPRWTRTEVQPLARASSGVDGVGLQRLTGAPAGAAVGCGQSSQ